MGTPGTETEKPLDACGRLPRDIERAQSAFWQLERWGQQLATLGQTARLERSDEEETADAIRETMAHDNLAHHKHKV
ncbi:hypothetical protein KFU94_01850 [Chloroflexi bacterium TSY]|nr:hypothetical protein [Chloroflexi bacterium TSY]